jgi:hypothetical protein
MALSLGAIFGTQNTCIHLLSVFALPRMVDGSSCPISKPVKRLLKLEQLAGLPLFLGLFLRIVAPELALDLLSVVNYHFCPPIIKAVVHCMRNRAALDTFFSHCSRL